MTVVRVRSFGTNMYRSRALFYLRRLEYQPARERFQPTRTFLTERPDLSYIRQHYQVRRRGDDGHGSREYLLIPPEKTVQDDVRIAALMAHRNILFGARSFDDFALADVCPPLVAAAVKDAGENGEQPQAIASLSGLSDWIRDCLDERDDSAELAQLRADDPQSYEAVQAIATGIPREGHSMVGMGTYRDGENGWKKVATEFVERDLSEEASLYRNHGARLVGIEHLADKNPEYLQSAGGAMARLFFL